MFSGKQRELEDRRSKQNGLNRATGGSRGRRYTQIKTQQVLSYKNRVIFVNIYT